MPESPDAARLQQIRERHAASRVCYTMHFNTAVAGRPHSWIVRRSGLQSCRNCGAYWHEVESDEAFLLAEIDQLAAELQARPPLEVEYGLMLRDGTVLTADSYEEREARAAQFEAAQWEITRLRREKRPADVYTWTEEPTL